MSSPGVCKLCLTDAIDMNGIMCDGSPCSWYDVEPYLVIYVGPDVNSLNEVYNAATTGNYGASNMPPIECIDLSMTDSDIIYVEVCKHWGAWNATCAACVVRVGLSLADYNQQPLGLTD